jgi:hypothetical protein
MGSAATEPPYDEGDHQRQGGDLPNLRKTYFEELTAG